MAEKLCELRKKGGGGGKYTETVLWTNPSPNSTMARTTVTLSDDWSNYDYLKIPVKLLAADANEAKAYVIIDTATYDSAADVTLNPAITCNVSNVTYCRRFARVNDTYNQILIFECNRLGNSGTTNGGAIPLQIIGVKKA